MLLRSLEEDILQGFRSHAARFYNHKKKPLVLQKYRTRAADPAKGGLRRCTAHVAAWLAFAPPGPCAVIGSDPDLQPAMLLARLLKGLRTPGPRLLKALALINDRLADCSCVGHKALELRLQRYVPQDTQHPNLQMLSGDAEEERDAMIALDAVVSAASSSKLAQQLNFFTRTFSSLRPSQMMTRKRRH